MDRKQPDEWKYPGGRWIPLMIGVVALVVATWLFVAGMSTIAVSIHLCASFLGFLVQLEYEWSVGVLS